MIEFNEIYTIIRNKRKRIIPYIAGTLVISSFIPLALESCNKDFYLSHSKIVFKKEVGRNPISYDELSDFNCKKLNLQENCSGLSKKVLKEVARMYAK